MFSCSATHLPSRQCCGGRKLASPVCVCLRLPLASKQGNRFTTYQAVTTSGSLGRGSIGDAVATGCVEAEELGAHSLVLEARGSASITATLRVQREKRSRQGASQRLILMRCIMQTSRRVAAVRRWGREIRRRFSARRLFVHQRQDIGYLR